MQKNPVQTNLLLPLTVAALLFSSGVRGEDEPRFQDLLPEGVHIVNQAPSEVAGLNVIEFSDGRLVYAFDESPFFFTGDLYRFSSSGALNLSETYRADQRKEILGRIDPHETMIFPATVAKRDTLWVFTDTTCGYCQLFHRSMEAYNALGLEVRYLAFPRRGIDSNGGEQLRTAWCSDDPKAAMTRLKRGEILPPASCDSPVERHFELGQRLGVRGTPAIFSASGVRLPGYVPPDEIMAQLGFGVDSQG